MTQVKVIRSFKFSDLLSGKAGMPKQAFYSCSGAVAFFTHSFTFRKLFNYVYDTV